MGQTPSGYGNVWTFEPVLAANVGQRIEIGVGGEQDEIHVAALGCDQHVDM